MVGRGLLIRRLGPAQEPGRLRMRRWRCERLNLESPGPMASPAAPTQPGTPPAAGGRGRSCGPGCAARVAAAPAARRCTPPPTSPATWGRTSFSFCWPFSSRSSVSVSAGLQHDLSVVAAGIPASTDQSAGLSERALSLGGDYTHVMGLAASWCASPSLEHDSERGCHDGGGLDRGLDRLQVCRAGRSEAGTGRECLATGPGRREGWRERNVTRRTAIAWGAVSQWAGCKGK